MSEREELADVLYPSHKVSECKRTPGCHQCDGTRRLADAVLASNWLRAHDDRIRAEALAPVLALADECERLDAYLSHDVTDLSSPMGWRGVNRPAWEVIRTAAALRVAAGTPTHHTTEDDA